MTRRRRATVDRPPAGHSRGRWILLAAVVPVAAVLLAAWRWHTPGPSPSPPTPSGPDVILVTIDTLRADHVGCYGGRGAATPIMDGLAARGVRFPLAVAHVPLTLPSHASILTGLTPPRHGVRNNSGFVLGPGVPTLAERFGRAGYLTAAFVSGFPVHHRFGLGRGFAEYDDRFPRGDDPARPSYVERRADLTVGAAVAWLRQSSGADTRPVFLWLHLFDPHAPYEPPEPYKTRFRGREYDGEVAFADEQLGVLLDRWRQVRAGREPIVLVTADHGEGLGDHGEPTHGLFLYDSTTRVPFILAGPGVARGVAPQTLVRGIDIAPTLLDLAGLPPMAGVEGRSLRQSWSGRGMADDPAYVESLFGRLSFGWAPLFGWRERGLLFVDAPRAELYDAAADPGQLRNVAEARADEAARMRRALQAALARSPAGASPTPVPAESAERLRSLGYSSGGAIAHPSLRDPKDLANVAVRIDDAIAIERADPPRAILAFRDVLRSDPANPLARRHLAVALGAARRYDEAAAEVRTLVDGGDDSAEASTLLGDCLRLGGRLDEALNVLTKAAARDPSVPDALDGQGKVLMALGRLADAREAFSRARSIAPDDPDALAGLADVSLKTGDLAGARDNLEALVSRDPGDPDASFKLGVVLVRIGEPDRAIGLLRTAVERRPGNVDALVAFGGLLAKTGHAAEAVPYFERAIKAGARSPVVWNGLAMARLESGNAAGAADALRQSLRGNPAQPDIRSLLDQLTRATAGRR